EIEMDITEVRVKLMETEQEERLLGFCSITFDHAFVIRDLKIIRGSKGFFVAMPSRKLTDRCPGCGGKNQLRAAYCNDCGESLAEDRSFKQPNGKAKLFSDIAHPINSVCRDLIQEKVLEAYEKELLLFKQANYICRYEDYGENDAPHSEVAKTNVQRPQSIRIDKANLNKQPHKPSSLEGTGREFSDDFGAGLF
ncbi:SpoVG family protein, partial [Planctomicrobium sp.]|nr:SpoVG family protein [Planctomicrobium sp.]